MINGLQMARVAYGGAVVEYEQGRDFHPRPGRGCATNDSGQVVHTHVPCRQVLGLTNNGGSLMSQRALTDQLPM